MEGGRHGTLVKLDYAATCPPTPAVTKLTWTTSNVGPAAVFCANQRKYPCTHSTPYLNPMSTAASPPGSSSPDRGVDNISKQGTYSDS